jgi:methyl-accepting chemotaxis protein
MEIREFWSKVKKWLSSGDEPSEGGAEPRLDDEGLIARDVEELAAEGKGSGSGSQGQGGKRGGSDSGVPAGSASAAGGIDKFAASGVANQNEKMQASLNRVVDKLEAINGNLEQQLRQHKELLSRLDTMPELVKSFPAIVENQEKIRLQLSEQLSDMQIKNEQFLEAVEKIPSEAGRQTDLLEEINEQLNVTADAEDNMATGFKKFNEILARLNQNTISHTDSIMQMSKTFSTSEKYLKYVISRQNKQFMWLFAVSMGICVVAIAALTGIILYLAR